MATRLTFQYIFALLCYSLLASDLTNQQTGIVNKRRNQKRDGLSPQGSYICSHEQEMASQHCGFPTSWYFSSSERNGIISNPHSFPYVVLILYKNSRIICGGTIISNKLVLTSASCFKPCQPAYNYYIKTGVHDLSHSHPNEMLYRANAIVLHERSKDINYDIALLQTRKEIRFTCYARKACLPDSSYNKDATCVTFGWGKTAQYRRRSPLPRQVSEVIGRDEECNRPSNVSTGSEPNLICAEQQNALRQLDRGSPLFCENRSGVYLSGIINWIMGHVQRNWHFNVFTNVTCFMSWINHTANELGDPLPP